MTWTVGRTIKPSKEDELTGIGQPSPHQHPVSDIVGLTETLSDVQDKLTQLADGAGCTVIFDEEKW